jgi:hypothetical protein
MAEAKKFQITVLSETIRLISDQSVEHMNDLSEEVLSTVDNVTKSGLSPEMTSAAKLLYALVIKTDELMKMREKYHDETVKNFDQSKRINELEIEVSTKDKQMSDFNLLFNKNKYNA